MQVGGFQASFEQPSKRSVRIVQGQPIGTYLIILHLGEGSIQRFQPGLCCICDVGFLDSTDSFIGPAHTSTKVSIGQTARGVGLLIRHWPNCESSSKSSPWWTMEDPKYPTGKDFSLSSPSLRLDKDLT